MSTNISKISVTSAVEELGALYCAMIGKKMKFSEIPSAFLWGPPGIGKSAAVRQIAGMIEKKTGKKVKITDVRLLLFSPVDLRGVPVPDKARQFAEWLRPKIFDMDPGEDMVNLLFLDELSAAPQSVQAAAYQITLDRMVGEHKLPDNTIVIGAGNRVTDRSVAYRMPGALSNRLMHFEIRVDFDSFYAWAVKEQLHPFVLGFLSFDSSKLYLEEHDADDVAFPTPRSWKFVSDILKAAEVSQPSEAHHLIGGCIGAGTALEFEGWCRIYRELPDIKDIFEGKCTVFPKKPDVLYALVSSLTARILEDQALMTDEELKNVCEYMKRLPVDFAAKFYRSISGADGLRLRLMKLGPFQDWMKRNRKFI